MFVRMIIKLIKDLKYNQNKYFLNPFCANNCNIFIVSQHLPGLRYNVIKVLWDLRVRHEMTETSIA
jgi:hypothetical protein